MKCFQLQFLFKYFSVKVQMLTDKCNRNVIEIFLATINKDVNVDLITQIIFFLCSWIICHIKKINKNILNSKYMHMKISNFLKFEFDIFNKFWSLGVPQRGFSCVHATHGDHRSHIYHVDFVTIPKLRQYTKIYP